MFNATYLCHGCLFNPMMVWGWWYLMLSLSAMVACSILSWCKVGDIWCHSSLPWLPAEPSHGVGLVIFDAVALYHGCLLNPLMVWCWWYLILQISTMVACRILSWCEVGDVWFCSSLPWLPAESSHGVRLAMFDAVALCRDQTCRPSLSGSEGFAGLVWIMIGLLINWINAWWGDKSETLAWLDDILYRGWWLTLQAPRGAWLCLVDARGAAIYLGSLLLMGQGSACFCDKKPQYLPPSKDSPWCSSVTFQKKMSFTSRLLLPANINQLDCSMWNGGRANVWWHT